jgi:alpha-L-fucosidase
LTAKHHDDFLLWDSQYPNPYRPKFHTPRDLVGEFVRAMRAQDIRVGLYYSGGPDWIFNPQTMKYLVDVMAFIPDSQAYADYVDSHYRELIALYKPDILWNDIGYPAKGHLVQILAEYYNNFPDGLINDRFAQLNMGFLGKVKPLRWLLNRLVESRIRKGKDLSPSGLGPQIGDYKTPEYTQMKDITPY